MFSALDTMAHPTGSELANAVMHAQNEAREAAAAFLVGWGASNLAL